MCTRATLAEVRRFQKIAGILTESSDLEERVRPGGCGVAYGGYGKSNIQLVKWSIEGDVGGRYICLPPGQNPDYKIDGHQLTKAINEDSELEEGTLPNPAQPCGPDFTAFITGPKPENFACIPNTQKPPTTINSMTAKKVVPKTTTPTVPTVAPQA